MAHYDPFEDEQTQDFSGIRPLLVAVSGECKKLSALGYSERTIDDAACFVLGFAPLDNASVPKRTPRPVRVKRVVLRGGRRFEVHVLATARLPESWEKSSGVARKISR